MSGKEKEKLSRLYHVSDLKGYLWRKKFYDNLWRYHDPVYGHQTYVEHVQPPIHVKDTTDDLIKYPEIMNPRFPLNLYERDKYDVNSGVINIKGNLPALGIEVIQVTEYYHCGDLTCGLFIYLVEDNSISHESGLKVGDVITCVKRTEVEKLPPHKWDRHVQKSSDTYQAYKSYEIKTIEDMMKVLRLLHPDEHVLMTINRNGHEMEFGMNVPFETKLYQRAEVPHVVVKTIPDMCIQDEYLMMRSRGEHDYIYDVFDLVEVHVDEDMNLAVEIPCTLTEYEFDIDNNGNLIIEHE